MDKKTIDTTVTSGSSNLITSGAVYTAINSISPSFSCTFFPRRMSLGGTLYDVMFNILALTSYTQNCSLVNNTSRTWQDALFDSSGKCSISYVESIGIYQGVESGSGQRASPGKVTNLMGYIAKGSGKVRMYLVYAHGSAIYSIGGNQPYVDFTFSNGRLSSISANVAFMNTNQYYTFTTECVSSISII